MKKIIDILLFIWQLPQNILGFLLSIRYKYVWTYRGRKVFFKENFFSSGVSLGNYIILDVICTKKSIAHTHAVIRHEIGHTIQSKRLGLLYLPTIGLLSVIGNLYDRLFCKHLPCEKRVRRYYSQLWEKRANNLGSVTVEQLL